MDEVVAYRQTVGGVVGTYYPHYNHLYSVAALTNAAGQVVERFSYDAYGKQKITDASGNVTRAKSSVGWDRGFTGYIADNETGLSYARNRMYSPSLGRFISRDPLDYYDGFGLYGAYFAPNGVDPTGTACVEVSRKREFEDEGSTPTGWIGGYYFIKFGYNMKGEACDKCCKAGTKNAGKWVVDYNLEVSGYVNVEGGLIVGVEKKFKAFGLGFKGFVGGKLGGYMTATGSGALKSDRCNDDDGKLQFCMRGELGVKGTLGAMFTAQTWWADYSIGGQAEVKARLMDVKVCVDCDTSGCRVSNDSKMNFGNVEGKLKICMGGCLTFDLFGSSGVSL